MKRFVVLSMLVVLVAVSVVAAAAETAPLGHVNLNLKLDYIKLTDGFWINVLNDFLYIAVDGYAGVLPNLYIGGEVGYASIDGPFLLSTAKSTFVPLELNAKYAVQVTPHFVLDLGAGASYIYMSVERKLYLFALTYIDDNDWLFGGQVFADAGFELGRLLVGINGKYQLTEEFKHEGFNSNNLRLGAHVGLMF